MNHTHIQPNQHALAILNMLVQINGVVIVADNYLFLPDQGKSIPIPTGMTWMFFHDMVGIESNTIDTATIFARLAERQR